MSQIGDVCQHSSQSWRTLNASEQDLVPSARFFCEDCDGYITMRGPEIHHQVVSLGMPKLITPTPAEPRRPTEIETLNDLIETHFKLLEAFMPEKDFEHPRGMVQANLNNALHEWHGLTGKPHRLEVEPEPTKVEKIAGEAFHRVMARATWVCSGCGRENVGGVGACGECHKSYSPAPILHLDAIPPIEPFTVKQAQEVREGKVVEKFLDAWSETKKPAVTNAAVVHPQHYNKGKFEVWDVIADWQLDFLLGNVVKYVARAGHKGKLLEDLQKAQQYLNKKLAEVEAAIPPEITWHAQLWRVPKEDHELPLVWIVYEDDAADQARRIYCDWIDDAHTGPRIDEAKAIRFAQQMPPDKKVLEIFGRPT